MTWLGLFQVGSRARGMAGPDSDYDLTGWYTQPLRTYLTLGEPPLQTLGPRELRLTDEGLVEQTGPPGAKVEFFARDFRTVLHLATNSNPHVLEVARLPSECVLLATPAAHELLLALQRGRVDPRRLVYHYASLGYNMLVDFERNGSDPKTLLHAVHAVLSARWAFVTKQVPPAPFASLLVLATEHYPDMVVPTRRMLAARQAGQPFEGPSDLYVRLRSEVDALREAAKTLDFGKPLTSDEADALWHATLVEHYGQKCFVL